MCLPKFGFNSRTDNFIAQYRSRNLLENRKIHCKSHQCEHPLCGLHISAKFYDFCPEGTLQLKIAGIAHVPFVVGYLPVFGYDCSCLIASGVGVIGHCMTYNEHFRRKSVCFGQISHAVDLCCSFFPQIFLQDVPAGHPHVHLWCGVTCCLQLAILFLSKLSLFSGHACNLKDIYLVQMEVQIFVSCLSLIYFWWGCGKNQNTSGPGRGGPESQNEIPAAEECTRYKLQHATLKTLLHCQVQTIMLPVYSVMCHIERETHNEVYLYFDYGTHNCRLQPLGVNFHTLKWESTLFQVCEKTILSAVFIGPQNDISSRYFSPHQHTFNEKQLCGKTTKTPGVYQHLTEQYMNTISLRTHQKQENYQKFCLSTGLVKSKHRGLRAGSSSNSS